MENNVIFCDTTKDTDIIDIKTPFSFPLDPFQKYAIKAISNDENVLVCAKTGSGKTLVAEFQIYHSLKKGKRVFYTTPIKSLSNQKFYDLKKIYGEKRVGIITGDIKFQPQADILIMTTEILRNLLYKSNSSTNQYGLTAGVSLEGLDAVIFDEVHYINDPYRGKVWEETLILLNRNINLVLLSATIGNSEELAEWIGTIKSSPIHLIRTAYRIVPLVYHTFDTNFNLVEISGTHSSYNEPAYIKWCKERANRLLEHDQYKKRVQNREEGQVITEGKVSLTSPMYQINQCIQKLKEKDLLPALFFIFSRKDCERYAKCVEQSLIDSSDTSVVKHIMDFHLHHYEDSLKNLEQYHSLRDLLLKGVAYHHSGMLPILKEIVEILFNKGYIKALFATETFAVGINMPTRTVVFLDYKKYDDQKQDMRAIRHDEFLQMAGRAGRRGIDTKGTVIYMPLGRHTTLEEHKSIVNGKILDIESRADFSYDFILKTIHSQKYTCDDIINLSYYNFSSQKLIKELQNKIDCNIEKQKSMNLEIYLKDLEEKKMLDDMNKTKEVQRQISMWNNKHIGPHWNKAIKNYSEYLELQRVINKSQEEITGFQNKITDFNQSIDMLISMELLKRDEEILSLTHLGVLATEINEANPLLIIELYRDNTITDLNLEEIICLISLFNEKKSSSDSESKDFQTHQFYWLYQKLIDVKSEIKILETSNILSFDFVEPMLKWFKGDSLELICRDCGIFPGNFYRTLMSCSNILDELITVSEIDSNIQLLEKLQEVKTKIFRDTVGAIGSSLYLKL